LFAQAFSRSGAEVRDAVWALHAFIKSEKPTTGAASLTEFEPWLIERLRGDAPETGARRRALVQWIDAANERLTMRRYARRDRRREHAGALIAAPMALWPGAAESSAPPELIDLAELALRFWDCLHAESQAALGRNRIARDDNGIGGFYGMDEIVAPPTAGEIAGAVEALARDLAAYSAESLGPPLTSFARDFIKTLHGAATRRLTRNDWPRRFAPISVRTGAGSLWRRIRERIGR
jgi:hypothetical protein